MFGKKKKKRVDPILWAKNELQWRQEIIKQKQEKVFAKELAKLGYANPTIENNTFRYGPLLFTVFFSKYEMDRTFWSDVDIEQITISCEDDRLGGKLERKVKNITSVGVFIAELLEKGIEVD